MHRTLTLVFLLITGFSAACAGGREVTVFRHDGRSFTGELISVRQDQISVYTGVRDLPDEEVIKSPADVVDIPVAEIDSLMSEGHSRILVGMAIGSGAGLAGGMIIGAASSNAGSHHDAFLSDLDRTLSAGIGGAIGLAAGFAIGTAIGVSASSGDLLLRHPSGAALADLAAESRFPLQGPDEYGTLKVSSKYGFFITRDAVILHIHPHSPAFDNDLRYRDRILAVNGTEVIGSSERDLRGLINQNDSLTLLLLRGRDTLSVVLHE